MTAATAVTVPVSSSTAVTPVAGSGGVVDVAGGGASTAAFVSRPYGGQGPVMLSIVARPTPSIRVPRRGR